MADKVSSRFVAAEEVVVYAVVRQAVGDLIASKATFGALLFSDLGSKLSALFERNSQHELAPLPFPDQYDMLLLRLGSRGAGWRSLLAHPNGP